MPSWKIHAIQGSSFQCVCSVRHPLAPKLTGYRVFVMCGHSLMLPVAAVMHVGVETGLPVGDVVHGADRPVRLHQRVLTWIQRRLLTGSMGLGYETDLLDDRVGVCPHVPRQRQDTYIVLQLRK